MAHHTALVPLSDSDLEVADPAQDIRGRRVHDAQGEQIGSVDDLLVDEQDATIRLLVLASGGFLGIGRDRTYLPVDAIREITDDTVTIDQNRQTVSDAPEYDPALIEDDSSYEGLVGYYGYRPFWAPGYAAPVFPAGR